MFDKGLFIFHRDLRIHDNIGLITASEQCKELFVCFVFTPEQVGKSNHYRSNNAIQFMIESLEDLEKDVKSQGGELGIFYGKQLKIIDEYIKTKQIGAVFYNKDYTPYAVERDTATREHCKKRGIECIESADYYLHEPGTVLTGGKTAYKKFTPFYDSVKTKKVLSPSNKKVNIMKGSLSTNNYSLETAMKTFVKKKNENLLCNGGRKLGLESMRKGVREQSHYDNMRNELSYQTSHLSAYIKFGCISIREVYHAFHSNTEYIRQLFWRDFFAHVLYSYPEVLGKSYHYRGITWRKSQRDFELWCHGETGFPIVDAGMRELNATGYMHNRTRMAVATFLVKTLLIDWRWGEQYFATQLVDYDIASNNGNWQGISSTGVDLKPYFKDMNPWTQSAKFDKNAEYIKKWIPELKDVDAKDIHKWFSACEDAKYKQIRYPHPMVDLEEQKKKMMKLYENTKA